MYSHCKTLEAQKKQAKIYIENMINDLGLDDFIEFYQSVELKLNNRELNRGEVEEKIKNTPKIMTYYIEGCKKQLEREIRMLKKD